MTKWFQNRSILFKLLAAGLPILVGISLSSALIMYLFFKISDRATRIHSIADTVTIGMLSARVAEKNFILHDLQKDVFYKSGGSVYLEEHKAHVMSARDEILKLISLLSGPQQEYVRSLLKLVDAYSDIFTEMVQSYGQRGFKDWGYLGQWRRAIHDVENSILRMNRPDLQEDLLQMRRLEKDYLLRGEDQYIDAILDLWHNLRSRIARVSGPLIEETLANLQTYAKAFKNYVAIQDKIGRSDADGLQKEFLGVINKMKSVLENILTEANRENQMARRNFILISIVIYVFGTLLGGVCFYFFSRSISATLVTLKDAALNVGKGRLDTRVPLDSRDEIGIVAAAFNTMAEDLNKVTVSKNYVDRIIESMADTLIVISPDLTIETVNRATLDLSGRSNEELVGHPADIIFGIESPEIFLRKLIERQFLRNLETTYIDKNGREIPVLFSGSVMFDAQGAIQGIVCVAQDHTQRRQAEQMLRKSERELRLLSSKILETQENERKRVAQELHDGIGQALTGIKFSIENSLRQLKMGSDANLTRGLETSVTMIQRTIEETRRIAMGLRPSSLDDIGITETILWFCRQFESIYTTIRIETNLGIEEKLLSDALKTTIFRVMQETLNNVVKHSGANLVRLKLLQKGKTVELTIEDNGVGFTPEEEFLKEGTDKGFGLASMKDRAELSGGQFAIQSKEGQGTVVRAFWPETVD